MNEPPADLATADQTDAERAAALDEAERQAEAATVGDAGIEPMPAPVNQGIGPARGDYDELPMPPDPLGDGIEDRGRQLEDESEPETYRIVTLEFATSEGTVATWGKVQGLIQSAESKGFRLMDGSVEDTTLISAEDVADAFGE